MRVAIIGAGGVATSMVHALRDKCEISQVFSRELAKARRLATVAGAEPIDRLELLRPDADVVIIAVKDDAIASVIDRCPDGGALWLHTSGSTPIDVFAGHRRRYGVLYPMQSFSPGLIVDMSETHFFVEASDTDALRMTEHVARLMSAHVTQCDSRRRESLHIAAVFACNFANHMWTLADEVMTDSHLPFEALLPLIRSTVAKLDTLAPRQSQTGPAARHDLTIVDRHLSRLDGRKRDIYNLLSQSIMNNG